MPNNTNYNFKFLLEKPKPIKEVQKNLIVKAKKKPPVNIDVLRPQGELYEVISTNSNFTYNLTKYSGYTYNWLPGGGSGTNFGGDLWLPDGQGTDFGARLDSVSSITPSKLTLVPGDIVEVCFYNRDRQLPYIKKFIKRSQYIYSPGGTVIVVLYGVWTQSNQEAGQLTRGYNMTPARYDITNNDAVTFDIPTTDDPGTLETGNKLFGLTWALHEETDTPNVDHFVIGFPVKRIAEPTLNDYAIGGWDSQTKANVWQANFEVGVAFPEPENTARTASFFYAQTDRWAVMIPKPFETTITVYSAKSETLKSVSTISKPGVGASLTGVTMLLPYSDISQRTTSPVHVVGLDVAIVPYTIDYYEYGAYTHKFYTKSDPTSRDPNKWEESGNYSLKNEFGYDRSVTIPTGSLVPVSSVYSMPNEPTPANKHVSDNAFLIFSSGRNGLTADSDNDVMVAWGYRRGIDFSLNPISPPFPTETTSDHWKYGKTIKWKLTSVSANSSLSFYSKEFSVADDQRLLSDITFNTGAQTYFPLHYGGYSDYSVGSWLNTDLKLAEDHHHYFISDTVSSGPSFTVGFPDRSYYKEVVPLLLPYKSQNNVRHTSLGAHFASNWPTNLENSTGGIIIEDRGNDSNIWLCVLEPYKIVYGGFITNVDLSTLDVAADNVGTVEVFFDSGVGYNIDGIGTSEGFKTRYQAYWVNREDYLWKTKIYRFDKDGNVLSSTDISQTIDGVSYSEDGIAASGTVDSIELTDNVWKIISFPDQDVLAVLRDLHADDREGNPSPHVEIYKISTMTKLSTIPIGTPDLLLADIPSSDFLAGDREWDPYFYGPPRMKGAVATISGTDVAFLSVLVQEQKKVEAGVDLDFQKAIWYEIELTDPGSPTVNTYEEISATPPGPGITSSIGGVGPLLHDFDSLLITRNRGVWARDSKVFESID